jgi:hypothetical protein
MTKPDTSRGVPIAGVPFLLHDTLDNSALKKPKPVTGNYLPATFEAEVSGCRVTFTLDLVRKSVRKAGKVFDSIQITSLHCECGGSGYVSGDLPLPLLRRLAIEASAFAAWRIPPHFTYSVGGVTWQTDGAANDFHIVGPGGLSAEVAKDFGAQVDLLHQVARVYHAAPYGAKYELIARQFGYRKDWAKKKVAQAKAELPHLFDQPGKKSKKGGKK